MTGLRSLSGGRRPRLLDLFCCAGGAAMGYHRAGFDVVGVDIRPQPRYPFEFIQADAFSFPLKGFDAVHASPLWYAFTAMAKARGFRASDADDVTPIYNRLRASGLPFVVESGSLGPLTETCLFCGPAFGLEVIRHMHFASNIALNPPACACVRGGAADGLYVAYKGSYGKGRRNPPRRSRAEWKAAAGLEGFTWQAAHLAVPPAYTQFIGERLLEHLRERSEPRSMTADLLDLAGRVESAEGPDRELEREAHEALGWQERRVTRLGLNGRTPGSWLWFPPDAPWGTRGRRSLPSVAGARVRKRLAAALRARSALPTNEVKL